MPHFVYAIAALAVIGICHLFTINVASGVTATSLETSSTTLPT